MPWRASRIVLCLDISTEGEEDGANADCAGSAVHGEGPWEEGIVSKAAAERLHNTTELDYMTHIVLRMYENKKCVCLSFLPQKP